MITFWKSGVCEFICAKLMEYEAMKSGITNQSFLIVSTAVRVMLWRDKTEPPPEKDADGLPVMAGDDDFYREVTNYGKRSPLIITFAPENDSRQNWTVYVDTDAVPTIADRIVLQLGDRYQITGAGGDVWYQGARVFGKVIERAAPGRLAAALERIKDGQSNDEINEPIYELDPDYRDSDWIA